MFYGMGQVYVTVNGSYMLHARGVYYYKVWEVCFFLVLEGRVMLHGMGSNINTMGVACCYMVW